MSESAIQCLPTKKLGSYKINKRHVVDMPFLFVRKRENELAIKEEDLETEFAAVCPLLFRFTITVSKASQLYQ